MPKTSKKRAFTLTELLVVVIVIGVLAAVVLPKYSKVLETRKTTEAEELMAAVRMEQEQRCALDKPYLSTATQLHTLASATTKNYAYSLGAGGMSASSTGGSYNYTLEMPSYADGRICCSGTDCNKLNKDYPSCDALKALADYQEATAECEASVGCDEGTKPSCLPTNPNLCGAKAGDAYCAGTEWACVGVVQGSANPGEETVTCQTEDGKTGTRTVTYTCSTAGIWEPVEGTCVETEPQTSKSCRQWSRDPEVDLQSLCAGQGMTFSASASSGSKTDPMECCQSCEENLGRGYLWEDGSCRNKGFHLEYTDTVFYQITPAYGTPIEKVGKLMQVPTGWGTECPTADECTVHNDGAVQQLCTLSFLDTDDLKPNVECTDNYCDACDPTQDTCPARWCYDKDRNWQPFMSSLVVSTPQTEQNQPYAGGDYLPVTVTQNWQEVNGQSAPKGVAYFWGCEEQEPENKPQLRCPQVEYSYYGEAAGTSVTCTNGSNADNENVVFTETLTWRGKHWRSPAIRYSRSIKYCAKNTEE